jgi:ribose/xylose/arabinose/galactoside ABC-type transport system permease subunit
MKNWIRYILLEHTIWVILAAVFISFVLFVPNFLNWRIISNILTHSVFIGVLAIGMSFALVCGHMDMSITANMAFTAMVGAVLAGTGGSALGIQLNPFLSLIIMLVVGCIVGFINGLIITKFKLNAFVATFGMMIVIGGFTTFFTKGQAVTILPDFLTAVGVLKMGHLPLLVWITLGLYIIAIILVGKTKLGRYMYAVGGNPDAAYKFGINPNRITLFAFMVSGFLAAIAGWLLIARMQTATPAMAGDMLFEVVASCVIGGVSLSGGRGTILGVLGGVILLSMFRTALNILDVSVYIVEVIRGLLILIAIIIDSLKIRFQSAAANIIQ